MNLSQFRERYPEYNDLSDADLAGRLHSKFYSDMPRQTFASRVGLTSDQNTQLDGAGLQEAAPSQQLPRKQSGYEKLETARDAAFMRGPTLGASDYVGAAGRYVGDWIANAIKPGDQPNPSFNEKLKEVREPFNQLRESSPVVGYGAEFAGNLAGAPVRAVANIAGNAVRGTGKAAQYKRYAAQGGALGAVGGTTYAEGEDGGLPTPGELAGSMVANTAGGTALGVALPGAIEGMGRLSGWVAQRVLDRIPAEQKTSAIRSVATAAQRDGMTPDRLSAKVRQLGPQATLADVSPELRALGEVVAQSPGGGAAVAERSLRTRAAGSKTRILKALRLNVSDDAMYPTLEALTAARSKSAQPLYEEAFGSAIPVHTVRTERLVKNSFVRKGINQGITIARNEADAMGVPLKLEDYAITGFNAAGDPVLGLVPTLRLLDAGKRGLDDILFRNEGNAVKDPKTGRYTQLGRSIEAVRDALVKELDILTTRNGRSLYREARQAWGGPSRAIDALHKGRAFAKGDVERTAKDLAGMSAGEKEFFRIGVARELEDMIKAPGTGAQAARRILDRGATWDKLQLAFPTRKDAIEFRTQLIQEIRFSDTERRALANSRTYAREAAAADIADNLGSAGEAALSIAAGQPANIGTRALQGLRRPPPGVSKHIAEMVFTRDPEKLRQAIAMLDAEARKAGRETAAGKRALDAIAWASAVANAR